MRLILVHISLVDNAQCKQDTVYRVDEDATDEYLSEYFYDVAVDYAGMYGYETTEDIQPFDYSFEDLDMTEEEAEENYGDIIDM